MRSSLGTDSRRGGDHHTGGAERFGHPAEFKGRPCAAVARAHDNGDAPACSAYSGFNKLFPFGIQHSVGFTEYTNDSNAVYTDVGHKAYRSIKGFQIEVAMVIEWGNEDGKDAFKGYGCHQWVLLTLIHVRAGMAASRFASVAWAFLKVALWSSSMTSRGNTAFKSGDAACVEGLLVDGFIGKFPDAFLFGRTGPRDA